MSAKKALEDPRQGAEDPRQGAHFTDEQLRRLLEELARSPVKDLQPEAEAVEPLSEAEVEEIEAAYQPVGFSAERDERQRRHLEALRQEWQMEVEPIPGIVARADAIGGGREKLAETLRVGIDVLFRVDMHMVTDLPARFVRRLAAALEVDARSLYLYLASPPEGLGQMAAASRGKPAAGEAQTWAEVIQASPMSSEDKAYWLEDDPA